MPTAFLAVVFLVLQIPLWFVVSGVVLFAAIQLGLLRVVFLLGKGRGVAGVGVVLVLVDVIDALDDAFFVNVLFTVGHDGVFRSRGTQAG